MLEGKDRMADATLDAIGTEVFRAVGGLGLLFLRWPIEPLVEEAKSPTVSLKININSISPFGANALMG